MPRRKGITDWFPTKGEARGLVEIKGRVGGSGGRMRRRRRSSFVKKRRWWIPYTYASEQRSGGAKSSLVIAQGGGTPGVAEVVTFAPTYIDDDTSRGTTVDSDFLVTKAQGCGWVFPEVLDTPEDDEVTNIPSNFLVTWYWHKLKADPEGGDTESDLDPWNPVENDGSGTPTEADAFFMRKDINKWGQGWTHIERYSNTVIPSQASYNVPASVAGDRIAYTVPAVGAAEGFVNPMAFQRVVPLRIPPPKLPVRFVHGQDYLALRMNVLWPNSQGLDGTTAGIGVRFVPMYRFLCER